MAKRGKKTRTHVNIPICLAAVLLCLTMFSSYFSSRVVARYTTTENSGDSARVIKFGDLTLTETGGDPQYIAPGVELEWNASLSFTGSEAATYVFVEVDGVASGTADAVTLFSGGPEWVVADGWEYLAPGVYYRALVPNAVLTDVALFESASVVVSEYMTAADIVAIGTISPSFRASVVQSNGFASPADAWDSLEGNHP